MNEPIFCMGMPAEAALYEQIKEHILTSCPDAAIKHDRTQTAFIRKVQFAWLSLPRRKADAGALMLSISLPSRQEDPRILYAAEVGPGRWMHHLIIRNEADFDEDICSWISAAWALVGPGQR